MRKQKQKYYTVWEGHNPGVYDTWEECRKQTSGFPQAKYKSFPSFSEAKKALEQGVPEDYYKKKEQKSALMLLSPPSYRQDTVLPLPKEVVSQAIAVDAACSGNPGAMEYRGVDLRTGEAIFHYGPVWGTNNIGEYLAIVHCLALLYSKGDKKTTVYSDSRTAMSWVSRRTCGTRLASHDKTRQVLDLVDRANRWLQTHMYANKIVKWETEQWGEIPADFGRK